MEEYKIKPEQNFLYNTIKKFKNNILTIKQVAERLQRTYVKILADNEEHQVVGYSDHYLIITDTKGNKSQASNDVFFIDSKDKNISYLLPSFIYTIHNESN